MKKQLTACFHPLLRAVVIRTAIVRGVFALVGVLLVQRFVLTGPVPKGIAHLLAVALFILGGWLEALRLNGAKLPRLKFPIARANRRDPMKNAMADLIDEPLMNLDELDEAEQAACALCANALCALLFLALSLFGSF